MDNRLVVPLIALGLVLMPVLVLVILMPLGWRLPPLALLMMIVSPIVGAVVGLGCLSGGRGDVGIIGMIIAFAAVVLPMLAVAIGLLVFVGAVGSGIMRM